MSWQHYPESPWGDVDICSDGNVRPHGSTEKICVICDYDSKVCLKKCKVCGSVTWHLLEGDRCLRHDNPDKAKIGKIPKKGA